jgi:hypothetical protein
MQTSPVDRHRVKSPRPQRQSKPHGLAQARLGSEQSFEQALARACN